MKQIIQKRLSEMKQNLTKINRALESAPGGGLKIRKLDGKVYYFHQFKNDETGKYEKQYIKKSNVEFARALAQKGYDSKAKNLIEKQIALLEKIDRDDFEDKIDELYDLLIPERKQLIKPIRLSVKEQLRKWNAEECKPIQLFPENLKYETIRGEMVRSKSELIIANILNQYQNEIVYKYECPLEVIIGGEKRIIYPDFTILNLRSGKITYLEHAGKMDEPRYANDFVKKVNTYHENGMIPGRDVIFTYETQNNPLKTQNIRHLIEEVLL